VNGKGILAETHPLSLGASIGSTKRTASGRQRPRPPGGGTARGVRRERDA
jgi:hypothetical protein